MLVTTAEMLRIITERFVELSRDAQEVLFEDFMKFADGALEHGPMDVERGDWPQHLLEELIDARFYIRMELLKRRRVIAREVEPVNAHSA